MCDRVKENGMENQVWWCMPVISALGSHRQEDCPEFKTSLTYRARSWLKRRKRQREMGMCVRERDGGYRRNRKRWGGCSGVGDSQTYMVNKHKDALSH